MERTGQEKTHGRSFHRIRNIQTENISKHRCLRVLFEHKTRPRLRKDGGILRSRRTDMLRSQRISNTGFYQSCRHLNRHSESTVDLRLVLSKLWHPLPSSIVFFAGCIFAPCFACTESSSSILTPLIVMVRGLMKLPLGQDKSCPRTPLCRLNVLLLFILCSSCQSLMSPISQ